MFYCKKNQKETFKHMKWPKNRDFWHGILYETECNFSLHVHDIIIKIESLGLYGKGMIKALAAILTYGEPFSASIMLK